MHKKLQLAVVVGIAMLSGLYWHFSQSPAKDDGKPIAQVKVPNLSKLAVQGKRLFDKNCSSCHGANAAGKQEIAPPLVHIIYEPNHHGDIAFKLAVKNGVRGHHWPFGNMPPIEGVSEKEIELITRYIRELQRANGIF